MSSKFYFAELRAILLVIVPAVVLFFLYNEFIGTAGWKPIQNEFKEAELKQLQLELNKKTAQLGRRMKGLENLPAHAVLEAGISKEKKAIADLDAAIARTKARPIAVDARLVEGRSGKNLETCATCHAGIERPEFADAQKLVFRTHPDLSLLKVHTANKIGCTSCHGGETGGLDLKHETLLKGNMVQSSCARCHSDAALLVNGQEAAQGARLFQTKACFACHEIKGSPYLKVQLNHAGPDLSFIKDKLSPEWLCSWIKNPRKLQPRTMMPVFGTKQEGLPDKEALQLTAYLLSVSRKAQLSPAALSYKTAHRSSLDTINRGREIFRERGCLGCHDMGRERSPAPRHIALDGIGSKVAAEWLYSWIEDPKKMSGSTMMPTFALNKEELSCLSDYLASTRLKAPPAYPKLESRDFLLPENIESGKKLIGKYGCYNCHLVPGFESNKQAVGPELSEFGRRDAGTFSWGKIKHTIPRQERSWYRWTASKLKDPKLFETKRLKKIMPNYELSQQELDRLLIFLKSLDPDLKQMNKKANALPDSVENTKVAGLQLVHEYNCLACHSLYGKQEPAGQQDKIKLSELRFGNIAPNLALESERVKSNWLESYLKKPYKMRPYLKASMPAFPLSDKDCRLLAGSFTTDGNNKPISEKKKFADSTDPKNAAQGKLLFDRLQCGSCHDLGRQPVLVESKLRWYQDTNMARRYAPDLSFAREKLNPLYVDSWLRNPHEFLPETTMPYMALTSEDAERLRAYLNSIGTNPANSSSSK